MKVFCKRTYPLYSKDEIYTKDKWYDVTSIDRDKNGKILAYEIVTNDPNYDGIYFYMIDYYSSYDFLSYFNTEQEIRKMKLNKIKNL
jgi:hypothetical protein